MINIGIGVSWAKALYSVANNIIANFRARVLSYPNSIFEAGPCLDATLEELNAIGLLDNASLIVTPNAYNEGVLYDVIPNTPLGDMDVVRATTATRVNSAGLIEVVPRNLFIYSNTFSNGNWLKSNGTISGTLYSNPSGVVNASKFIPNNSVTSAYFGQGVVNNSVSSTFSISVKADGFNRVAFWDGFVTAKFVAFDLILGTVVNTSGATGTIVNIGDGWFKCTMSANFPNDTIGWLISPLGNSAIGPFDPQIVGDGVKGIQVYAAQVENFATATEYFPTTTRLNIPRIDYTNGSCPSLLVEPQRTNMFNWSEKLIDGYAFNFTSGSFTVTENTTETLDPSGNNNSEKFTATTETINDTYRVTSGSGNLTLSIFAKKGTQNTIQLYHQNVATGNLFATTFNLNTGSIVGSTGTVTPKIENYGNGWFRCSITGADTLTTGNIFRLSTFSGTTYLFGWQLEQGSYPTSYIPTVASSVTRNADVISKTGISSLIGQTEGTIFADIDYDANIGGTKIITGLASSGSSFIYSFISGTTLVLSVYNSGILQCYLTYALPSSGKYKIAIGYKLNDFIVYVNGANVVSQTSGTVPTCSIIYVGNDFLTVLNKLNYNSVQLYKTRLTDEQLTLLTGDTYNSYAEMANSLNYILE